MRHRGVGNDVCQICRHILFFHNVKGHDVADHVHGFELRRNEVSERVNDERFLSALPRHPINRLDGVRMMPYDGIRAAVRDKLCKPLLLGVRRLSILIAPMHRNEYKIRFPACARYSLPYHAVVYERNDTRACRIDPVAVRSVGE